LKDMKIEVDRVINLDVPKETIIDRLKHRWIHTASGRVYNLEFNPPKQSGKDDVTGEPLVQRADDRKEVVLSRLKSYDQEIEPLIKYYSSKNLLETFTGNTSDYIWPFVKSNVENVQEAKRKGNALEKREPSSVSPAFVDPPTHTGQCMAMDDHRRVRFQGLAEKIVNPNFAIDLIAKEPIIVAEQRVVWSHSGGALGHPKIYINIDSDEVQTCGYSGRRFIQKKFYSKEKHGESVSFEQYLQESERAERFEQ